MLLATQTTAGKQEQLSNAGKMFSPQGPPVNRYVPGIPEAQYGSGIPALMDGWVGGWVFVSDYNSALEIN